MMEQKALAAQINSKNKKMPHKQEHSLFSEITYNDVREINYLSDLQEKKKTINFPIYQFEKEFEQEASGNGMGMLADQMYKKIMQNGFIQQKKAPSKRKKKNKNPFEYDYEDAFINDDETFHPKKLNTLKFENFKSLNFNIEEFYNSQLFKANITQIEEQTKQKTCMLTDEQLEKMKLQIKENISNNQRKAKQEMQSKQELMRALKGQIQLQQIQSKDDEFKCKMEVENTQPNSVESSVLIEHNTQNEPENTKKQNKSLKTKLIKKSVSKKEINKRQLTKKDQSNKMAPDSIDIKKQNSQQAESNDSSDHSSLVKANSNQLEKIDQQSLENQVYADQVDNEYDEQAKNKQNFKTEHNAQESPQSHKDQIQEIQL